MCATAVGVNGPADICAETTTSPPRTAHLEVAELVGVRVVGDREHGEVLLAEHHHTVRALR